MAALREALLTEKNDLQEAKRGIDRRLKLVNQLLEEYDEPQPHLPGVEAIKAEVPPRQSLSELGVRDAIRAVLASAGARGLKPAAVTKSLSRGGYDVDGSTNLGTRVRNEMWRMAKKGELGKTDGRYFLAEAEAGGDAAP